MSQRSKNDGCIGSVLSAAGNLGSAAQGLGPASGLITTAALAILSGFKKISVYNGLISIGVILAMVALLVIYQRIKKRSKQIGWHGDTPNNNPDWDILSDHRVAFVKSRSHVTYEYRFRLRAKRRAQIFRETFRWTGSGDFDVLSLSTGVEVSKTPSEIGRKLYSFIFPGVIETGQEAELNFRVVAVSKPHPADSFFAVTPPAVRSGSDNYIMVTFSDSIKVKELLKQTFINGRDWPEDRTPCKLDESRSVKLDYNHDYGTRHAITWEYDDGMDSD